MMNEILGTQSTDKEIAVFVIAMIEPDLLDQSMVESRNHEFSSCFRNDYQRFEAALKISQSCSFTELRMYKVFS